MTPEKAEHLGAFLRFYLDEANISQIELAKKAGVKTEDIGRICIGTQTISEEMAVKLANALGTSPELWTIANSRLDACDARG